ncbi:MAG: ATP-grasp fold amidoligase family protein [Paludibacter sp.]|nr:ATP-grasp fold amidoligase family protein [Paludibacter sp.]
MKEKLDILNPVTFNQKLQWLKLFDRKKIYTQMVDKYEAKKIVENVLGSEYVIPTLGVWDDFDDINFKLLPDKFVLKTTHDSGGVVICKDKTNFDIKNARKIINNSLKSNFYYISREFPYKNVNPRIIAEQYVVDESGSELKDYKFFCFNGEPKLLFVASNRNIDTRFDFFDVNFNHLDIKKNGYINADKNILKPKNFEKMVDISRKLSKDIPHIRIDLYNIEGQILFGEFTFTHWGGTMPFEPKEWDKILGDYLILPKNDM